MRVSIRTVLAILSVVTSTICKSLNILDKGSMPLVPVQLDINGLKELERIRSKVPRRTVYDSISQLNITIDEKRIMLRQYREKLQELKELDNTMDYQERIHRRVFHSYRSTENSGKVGYYTFPVKIAQPKDHRNETKVEIATLNLYRQSHLPQIKDQDSTKLSLKRNIGYNTVILVYQTLPGDLRRLVTSKVISLARADRIKIDVTEIAQSWVDEPGMNHGIEIECSTHNISQILKHPHSKDLHQPTLDITTYERPINVARRVRRQTDNQAETETSPDRCCRPQPVEISHADIVGPKDGRHDHSAYFDKYIYVCAGECPIGYKLHNFWSRIKNNMRKNHPDSGYKTQCAPVAYESTKIFHIDENSLSWTVANDVLVKECACV